MPLLVIESMTWPSGHVSAALQTASAILNLYKKGRRAQIPHNDDNNPPSPPSPKHSAVPCDLRGVSLSFLYADRLMMARLTACFALSAVLVLATGICSGNGQPLLEEPFPTDPVTGCLQFRPGGYLPLDFPIVLDFLVRLPPLRIISRGNTSLSIAADDNGNVVLTKTNCRDLRQVRKKAHVN